MRKDFLRGVCVCVCVGRSCWIARDREETREGIEGMAG
jgi:hypothetical protein